MSVTIGQASIDEKNGISGGAAGDQTGRELNTRAWYANGWTLCLRFKDRQKAQKCAEAAKALIAGNKVGYDQSQRNTLRAELRKVDWNPARLVTPCETDCSAFAAVCAEAAGVPMEVTYTAGNAPATFQMRQQWAKTGAFELLTDSKYLTSDRYLMTGDILVNESRHACIVLSDGTLASPVTSQSAGTIKMIVNGRECWVPGHLVGGTNYLNGSVREIFGAMGAYVGNQGSTPVITIK